MKLPEISTRLRGCISKNIVNCTVTVITTSNLCFNTDNITILILKRNRYLAHEHKENQCLSYTSGTPVESGLEHNLTKKDKRKM